MSSPPSMSNPLDPGARAGEALLKGLTDPQREAVTTTQGPLLVLAAAGSGKTRVITRRVAYLLSQGVAPWQILALTFTNKAAGEMRDRVANILADPSSNAPTSTRGLTITTFHALCARLLRRYADTMDGKPNWRIKGDYAIYDTSDQLSLIKAILKKLDLSTSNWPPRSCLSAISAAKNELHDHIAFEALATDFHARIHSKIYTAYTAALRKANAVDFDDLLMLTVQLLRESHEAREEIQRRWRYLMIDEYQDTNRAQFMLSTLLLDNAPAQSEFAGEDAPHGPNVCVVGDPDQSIYGWRGADIRNILEFEDQYPSAQVIALGQNFRSTPAILKAADTLIQHNKKRRHKPLFTENADGELPQVVLCRNEHHEADLVLDFFERMKLHEELHWREMAVFYRNNSLSRVMEDRLRRAGIPYIIARGTAFYEREEVKDLIAYLRVVANPSDGVSLNRIINKPSRKIGKTSLAAVEDYAARFDMTIYEALKCVDEISSLTKMASNAMSKFVATVDSWNGSGTFMGASVPTSLAQLVERVARESGLEKHYAKVASRVTGEPDEEKVANLEELINAAAEFEEEFDPMNDPGLAPSPDDLEREADTDTPPLLAMLRAFLESVALVADADRVDPANGAVTLMTLHAAKGLEFPAVAMIGLEQGLLPGHRALDSEDEMEEERRLAFVGITRAMRSLQMTTAKYRTHRGMTDRAIPSRFLRELPEDGITITDRSDEYEDDNESYEPKPRGGRSGFGAGYSSAGSKPSPTTPTYSEFDQRPMEERLAELRAKAASQPQSADGYTPGAVVEHPQFGTGTIERITGRGMNRRATIVFKDLGRKTLVLQYARLSVAKGTAAHDLPDEPAQDPILDDDLPF